MHLKKKRDIDMYIIRTSIILCNYACAILFAPSLIVVNAGRGLGADFSGRLSSALFPLVSRCERALIPIRCAFTLLLKRVYTVGCIDAATVEF